jgi:hypothetical protein
MLNSNVVGLENGRREGAVDDRLIIAFDHTISTSMADGPRIGMNSLRLSPFHRILLAPKAIIVGHQTASSKTAKKNSPHDSG